MITRRAFLAAASSTALSQTRAQPVAQIAISMDLEMSRNFPTWETTHWDYEKGNLDLASKAYATACARRVHQRGGRIHYFLVARALEQDNIGWLEDIAAMGHPIGNHTYDHVYVLAKSVDEIQFRFRRAPWLLHSKNPAEVIAENVRLCTQAMRDRLKITPNGFRTPGGFATGLDGRADVQRLLKDAGFTWVSAKYTRHPIDAEPARYMPAALDQSQPYRYSETGLLEIPMSPISDINAFRTGRWKLDKFLEHVRYGVQNAIDRGLVYDLLIHPSCIGVVDPQFKTIDLMCDLVENSKGRAKLVSLDQIAASQKA